MKHRQNLDVNAWMGQRLKVTGTQFGYVSSTMGLDTALLCHIGVECEYGHSKFKKKNQYFSVSVDIIQRLDSYGLFYHKDQTQKNMCVFKK